MIGELLTLVGATLVLLAGLGLVRFGDPLARMHALAKGSTLGLLLVLVGAAVNLHTLNDVTSVVLAVASIGAVALARVGRRQADSAAEPEPPPIEAPGVRRIVFIDVSVHTDFHVVMLASVWLLFAGHNQPGGGFVGGLLAGSAITLNYIAGGIGEVRSGSRFRPWTVLGAGLLLAAGTAAFPLVTGGSVLDVASGSWTLPLIGTMNLSSALLFDAGVYLAVVGMVLMAFEAFGDEAPVEASA